MWGGGTSYSKQFYGKPDHLITFLCQFCVYMYRKTNNKIINLFPKTKDFCKKKHLQNLILLLKCTFFVGNVAYEARNIFFFLFYLACCTKITVIIYIILFYFSLSTHNSISYRVEFISVLNYNIMNALFFIVFVFAHLQKLFEW